MGQRNIFVYNFVQVEYFDWMVGKIRQVKHENGELKNEAKHEN